MRPEFDRRGVKILTVSTDTPEDLRNGHPHHGIKGTMLSDRDLEVTDAFGLRNKLIHSAPPGDGMEALPVPATLLVDRTGKVLWKDQSDNYQRRSGPEFVLAAMQAHLD